MNWREHFSGRIQDDSMNLNELKQIRIEIQRVFLRCSICSIDRDGLLAEIVSRRLQILNPDRPVFKNAKATQKEMF